LNRDIGVTYKDKNSNTTTRYLTVSNGWDAPIIGDALIWKLPNTDKDEWTVIGRTWLKTPHGDMPMLHLMEGIFPLELKALQMSSFNFRSSSAGQYQYKLKGENE
jgi:hypothetical protein